MPYWISSILDDEFLQMNYEIPRSVMITNDELTSTNGVVSGEWTPINRVANCDYIPSNVIASAAYISNVLTRDQYNTSNNAVTSITFLPNNHLAVDGVLPSSIVPSGELLLKKDIACGIARDEMFPDGESAGPGAMVAGEALPSVASDAAQQGDSDDALLREYDVDVSFKFNVDINVLYYVVCQ